MNRSTKRQAMKKWGQSRSNRKNQVRDEVRRSKQKESPRTKCWSYEQINTDE